MILGEIELILNKYKKTKISSEDEILSFNEVKTLLLRNSL